MFTIKSILLSFVLLFIAVTAFPQEETHVFDSKVKTLQVNLERDQLTYPYLILGSNNKIKVSFDYLDANVQDLSYTLVHCDATWQPSLLSYFEYIEGFEENTITDYASSLNTTVEYSHYSFLLPNDELKIKKSGNYIVKVFFTSFPDSVIFQHRFVVYESLVDISAVAKRPTLVEKSDEYQEVDFTIDIKRIDADNPYDDIKVVLLQNGIWQTGQYDLEPLYVKQSSIEFDITDDGLIKGNNEFRRLTFKNFKNNFENTEKIEFDKKYIVSLRKDEDKRFKVYFENEDFNGKYYVFVEDFEDIDVMADYATVKFKIEQDKIIAAGDIYVWGGLTNWELKKENKLNFNAETNCFEGELLLKQGYYNYYYVYVPEGETKPDIEYFEGSHYETENDYVVLIYLYDRFFKYDRLVGLEIINTQKK